MGNESEGITSPGRMTTSEAIGLEYSIQSMNSPSHANLEVSTTCSLMIAVDIRKDLSGASKKVLAELSQIGQPRKSYESQYDCYGITSSNPC